MQRVLLGVAVLLSLGLASGVAVAESCSPAMCAGMSPACWDAYTRAVVAKDDKIGSVNNCRGLADDLDGKGHFMKVPDLTPEGAMCACEAVFWSQGGDAQGLPDIVDTTEGDDNSADDDE